MNSARHNLLSLAIIGAATAGGGVAIANVDGGSSTPPAKVESSAAKAVAVRTADLHRQVSHLLAQDQTLQSALRDARVHLALRVRRNERVIARQKEALARTAVVAAADHVPAPVTAPASTAPTAPRPHPTHHAAPSPTPKPTHHGRTGASGSGGQSGGDDGGGEGGDDGPGDD